MLKIEWYNEYVNEFGDNELNGPDIKGKKYHLKYGEHEGYIKFNNSDKEYNGEIGFASFGDVELTVKREGAYKFPELLAVYNCKTQELIAHVGKDFIFKNVHHNIYPKVKSIFYSKTAFDLVFEIYKVYSNIDLRINAKRRKKCWYKNAYTAEIEGNIEVKDNTDLEFLLCSLFAFELYIEDELQRR